MAAPLRAIGVFHAVARTASITRAATELGVTPSAVSQQIRSLEQLLGTSLLVKSGRRIKLTEAGERFFEMVATEVEHIIEATARIRGHHATTVLTIRATPTFSTKWLLPRLASFINRFPQYELRLDGTNEPTDFSRERVDLEIRHGTGDWPGLIVEPVMEERFFPICAPSTAEAGTLEAEALPSFRLIHSVKSQVQWPAWFRSLEIVPARPWKRVLFDRSHMAIDAALAGMGIALESNLMAGRELRDGRLVCPVRDPPAVRLVTQWIVCPHEHLRHAKVRAFIEWLKDEIGMWSRDVPEPRAARDGSCRPA